MPALGKILIIDDNEDVLFALHLLLEPYAEKVKVMRSPDRIVHFITDFRPDIVLLDMNFTRDTVSGQEGMDCLAGNPETGPPCRGGHDDGLRRHGQSRAGHQGRGYGLRV